jgi:hypothetical protein
LSELLRRIHGSMIEVSRGSNAYQESTMLFNEVRRLVVWLTRSHTKTVADQSAPLADTSFEFDPMWHGDHWQNLLSSPMDARRYVMEDWSVSATIDWSDVDDVAPAH